MAVLQIDLHGDLTKVAVISTDETFTVWNSRQGPDGVLLLGDAISAGMVYEIAIYPTDIVDDPFCTLYELMRRKILIFLEKETPTEHWFRVALWEGGQYTPQKVEVHLKDKP
jgi:hypothetical protein